MAINERLIDTKAAGGAGAGDINYVYTKVSTTIYSYDVSDPSNMVLGSSVNTTYGGNNLSIDSVNNLGYTVSGRALNILDLSDPTNLTTTTKLLPFAAGMQECRIDSTNSILYASDGTYDRIRSINVSNPASPSQLQSLQNSNMDNPYGLAIDLVNDFAYLACSNSDKLASVDISNSSSMSYQTSSATTNLDFAYSVDLDIVNEVAYVTSRTSDSLVSIDISNPSTSLTILDSVVDTFDFDNANCVKLDLTNQVAYVSSFKGITSVDISDPSNMSILDFYNDSGSYSLFFGVVVDSAAEIIYVQDLYGDLISLDVSDPSNMTEISTLATGNSSVFLMT